MVRSAWNGQAHLAVFSPAPPCKKKYRLLCTLRASRRVRSVGIRTGAMRAKGGHNARKSSTSGLLCKYMKNTRAACTRSQLFPTKRRHNKHSARRCPMSYTVPYGGLPKRARRLTRPPSPTVAAGGISPPPIGSTNSFFAILFFSQRAKAASIIISPTITWRMWLR